MRSSSNSSTAQQQQQQQRFREDDAQRQCQPPLSVHSTPAMMMYHHPPQNHNFQSQQQGHFGSSSSIVPPGASTSSFSSSSSFQQPQQQQPHQFQQPPIFQSSRFARGTHDVYPEEEVNPFQQSRPSPRQQQQQQQQQRPQNPFQGQQQQQPQQQHSMAIPTTTMPHQQQYHNNNNNYWHQQQGGGMHGGGPTTNTATSTTSNNSSNPVVIRPVDVQQVRNDWRKHGVNLSQALEDVRTSSSRNPCHLRVRVIDAVERLDPVGQKYTAYVIELSYNNTNGGGTPPVVYVERRYNDFLKFKESFSQHTVPIQVPFPGKNSIFYQSKSRVITDRMKQLDAWLVYAVVEYNNGRIVDDLGFLQPGPLPLPYQRFDQDNDIMGLFLAVQIIQSMTIPMDLWRTAVGVFIYTNKAMLPVPTLTGLLMARRPNNSWSAPIAIQTVGISTSSFVVITRESVIRDVCTGTRLDMGATQDVLVPVLDNNNNNSAATTTTTTTTYATAATNFASVVSTVRTSVNAKFYGKAVDALHDLWPTDGPTHIPAAQALYEALQQVRLY
jgi:lipid-binding SYLF domain-containing protein